MIEVTILPYALIKFLDKNKTFRLMIAEWKRMNHEWVSTWIICSNWNAARDSFFLWSWDHVYSVLVYVHTCHIPKLRYTRFGKILLMIKKYLSGTKIVLWMFERKVISIWKVILKVLYILTHAEYEANIYH